MGITNLTTSWFALFFGSCLLLYLAKTKWPGWLGLPFLLLVFTIVLDVGVTPIAIQLVGNKNFTIVGMAAPGEVSGAIFLILLNAFMIAMGMFLAWWLWKIKLPKRNFVSSIDYSQLTISKAWKVSLAMFIFGLLCNVFVLHSVLRGYSINEIAAKRAVFTSEVVWNPLYNYARLLSQTMIIGEWGMLLFSNRNKKRLRLAILAISVEIILQIFYGGRLSVINSLLAVTVLFHYGIRPIKLREIAFFCIAMFFGLFIIMVLRFKVANASVAFLGIVKDLLVRGSINEVAFALRMFPTTIPYLSWGPLVGRLSHLFPTLGHHVPGAKSLWMYLVDYIFNGYNPAGGIGGEHYATAAEHYMQFGMKGVVFLGLAFGFFYGCIFAWQKRWPKNLFLLMLATYSFKGFFASLIDGKMASWIGGIGFAAILPIGILVAVTTFGQRRAETALLFGSLCICIISFFLRRIFNADIYDYTFAIALIPAYLMSLKLISKAGPKNEKIWDMIRKKNIWNARVSIISSLGINESRCNNKRRSLV